MRSRSVLAAAVSLTVTAALTSLALEGLRATPGSGPSLETLRWMSGHWRQEGSASVVEELWMPPAGGMMIGINRTVPRQGATSFEFLRIEQRSGGIFYVASPGGAPPTDFALTECDEHHARFENPEHDFPKVIEYALDEDGQLRARTSGDSGPGSSWALEKATELD